MTLTRVYDKQMNELAVLENATAIDIQTPTNGLWEAGFTLPLDDPKNEYCEPFNRVRLFKSDGKEIGLFQIVKENAVKKGQKTKSYKLEHVLATLLDGAIEGDHQTDNQTIAYNIEYLLSFQTEQNWVLGQCDFEYLFSYKFENVNGIYNALKSLTKQFPEPFHWTWDTSTYPWKLNLLKAKTKPDARIRYAHNLKNIERDMDAREVITRIIPLGYGEGVNQLDITSVNGGKNYIDAEPELIEQFGIKKYIMVDRSIEDAQTLYNVAKAMLDEYKRPPVRYRVGAGDVSPITGNSADELNEGSIVEVIDDDLGTFQARIVSVRRPDVTGKPGDVELEIERKSKNITDNLNELRDRQRINEVNAQGATNIDSHDYADNADADHPAVIKFYIPSETVHINKMLLNYETSAFRAYSRSTKSGGGSTVTSASGGGTTVTSASGGSSTQTTSSGGKHQHMMFQYNGSSSPFSGHNTYYAGVPGGGAELVGMQGQSSDLYTYEAAGEHSHVVNVPAHTHSVTPKAHTHDVQIPPHSHGIDYGIYEEPTTPSNVTVKVDGNTISGLGTSESDVDIIPYLSKDSGGKVARGQWHEVSITPDQNGRIEANIIEQFFIQSRGSYTA